MAKMRSPNFPAVPLGQAIDLVGKIHREDRTNAIDKDVAAKHMGYTGLTGRTLKLLGALSQFGLVEKVGKGQIRVSKTAVSILHWADENERREAIAKAGTSPTLFRRIRDSFDDPSDRTITSYLVKEGFTDTAIPAVLKSYKETNRFLADAGVSESYGRGDEEGADSFSDEEDDDPMKHAPVNPPQESPHVIRPTTVVSLPPGPMMQGLSVNFDMKSVTISGHTTSPTELREFIKALTGIADLFDMLTTPIKDLPPPPEDLNVADE